MSDLKSVVWYITNVCANKCPYCFFVQQKHFEGSGNKKGISSSLESNKVEEPFVDSDRWVEAWNKLKPEILDITGGEPFLQPRFIDLVEGLDSDIGVAITTSLQDVPLENNLSNFVERIDPKKVFSMTLSYHPSQLSWEKFEGRALLLKNRGFNLTCNFVTWPEQLWLVDKIQRKVEAMGIRFHVDPYVASHIQFKRNDAEASKEAFYTGQDRKLSIDETDVPDKPVICRAGRGHLQVGPDGTARRCGRIGRIVGNILNPNFKLMSEAEVTDEVCSVPRECQSCDRDKTQPTWRYLK